MKITQFGELRYAVNKIGIDIIAKTEVKKFESEGLDTDLPDIYSGSGEELYTVLKDGTIRKVIVHICDISNYREDWSLPKFHIFECSTLEDMRKAKRGHRYKKTSRNDGKFWMIKKTSRGYSKLDICGNCLTLYRKFYGGYVSKIDFDLKKYVEKPIIHIQPSITDQKDMAVIPQKYSKDWSRISKERKEYCKWICQNCYLDLSERNLRQYLHTHHIDANIENNTHENLKVLCIKCHAEEFEHEHIKTKQEYKDFIKLKKNH